ncbi:ABC transporter substrate-binding protein [Pseudothauera rhizosphaerae]|uniref:Amino acid-binding protein n=1 Tax=Pseudothauera rhizosphaerae TaxID=2565932 RepID=A0A4S4A964_9RHOO|nr:ABC transporter substrate-binding protein [Pseudothauera rhizosphaerae]THF55367.1 amino acid-binding protein [Pseudothauera rhizosphaerae]
MLRVFRSFAVVAGLAAAGLPFGAAADGREIVIGQVAPFSGSQAVTGRAIHAGVKLYIDHVNAQGGVRGAKVRLVTRDDAQKADKTVALVRELIEQESPVALIGTVGTTNVEALIADGVLHKTGVPLVGAVSGASTAISGSNVFVIKASYHEEVNRLFTNLAGLNIKRVGLVYQDDALGQDVIDGAEIAAKRHGIELTARAGYPRNTVEVEATVEAMLKADPQVVFLGATTLAAIEFVRQYRAAGGTATLYGMSIIDTRQLLDKLGPVGARGFAFSVVLPLETQRTIAVNLEYLRLREKSDDPDLSGRSIEGFIAAKTLVHALQNAGSTPTAATVVRSLHGIRRVDLGGYTLDFAQKGRSGSSYVDFAMLGEGGRVVH